MRFGVKGYPTLLLVKENKTYRFAGQRNPELMVKFMYQEYESAKEIADVPKYEIYAESFIEKYFNNIWIFVQFLLINRLL